MWEGLKRFLDDSRVQTALILLIALWPTITAILQPVVQPSWRLAAAFVVFVGVSGLMFFAINQYTIFRVRKRVSPNASPLTDSPPMGSASVSLESQIKDWLYNSHHFILKSPNPAADFHIEIGGSDGTFSVARLRGGDELIFAAVRLIQPVHYAAVDALTAPLTSTLIPELQAEMLRAGAAYQGLKHPLRQIVLEFRAPINEIGSESQFFERFRLIRRAAKLLDTRLGGFLRQSGVPPHAPGTPQAPTE